MDKEIYLDNAATTRPYHEAIMAGLPYLYEYWHNPSSAYPPGGEARRAVERSRQIIADTLGADPEEIFFTSGATESNNWVISLFKGKTVLTTPIEHHALLRPSLSSSETFYLKVGKTGRVDPKELEKLIIRAPRDISLVSIMAANNEIGTVEPIKEIGRICDRLCVPFHTDATQYYGHQILNVNEIKADFVSASAHKFGGIKGVGFLYVRKGTPFHSFIQGGLQERGYRAGTENVFGIVTMAEAAKISCSKIVSESARLVELRSYFTERILNEVPGSKLTGDPVYRLPNNASFVFEGIRGEELVELLGMYGIYCSSGSACETGSDEPSHVLRAIGLSNEEANGSLRLTMGRDTTLEDLQYVIDKLKRSVVTLRQRNIE